MINSDGLRPTGGHRAFSLPLAVANGRFSAKTAVRISLGATEQDAGKNWISSIVVKPKADFTEPIDLKSIYAMGFLHWLTGDFCWMGLL
jgi:hypothetical protein